MAADHGPVTPYVERCAAVGKVVIEYADVHTPRALAQATWSARHGFGYQPGPLVTPITVKVADASGIGLPSVRRVGMPMPLGQLGQEMSPPPSRTPGVGAVAAATGPTTAMVVATRTPAVRQSRPRRRVGPGWMAERDTEGPPRDGAGGSGSGRWRAAILAVQRRPARADAADLTEP